MNRNKKILNVTMAAGMAGVLGPTPVIAAAQEADNGVSKEETVYVNATAEGEVKDITVSDWLKNSGSAEGDVSDVSDLEGIKNVKGDETFTQDGDKVTWNTDSSDIYYQGTSNKELPVDMKIKYYLDDQEITPEELAGKSGHLRMEVSYTNKSKKTVKVDKKDVEVYSPFVMVTGMILSSDNFSNVTIDNGKVISDGDKEMVVGVAVPGLKNSLDLSDDLSDKIDIPEGFTMEADGTFDVLPKKEVIELRKELAKLQKNLGGIKEMKRIPDAIFIVDPKKERICVQEAHTLGIPLIGICDTNCDPEELDYVIPGNDDAIRAVKLIVSKMADAVIEAKQGTAEADGEIEAESEEFAATEE